VVCRERLQGLPGSPPRHRSRLRRKPSRRVPPGQRIVVSSDLNGERTPQTDRTAAARLSFEPDSHRRDDPQDGRHHVAPRDSPRSSIAGSRATQIRASDAQSATRPWRHIKDVFGKKSPTESETGCRLRLQLPRRDDYRSNHGRCAATNRSRL